MKNYLIVAAIVLVAAVALIFYQYNTANTQTTKLTGLEIAKMSYGFFGKMRMEDGRYSYREFCTGEGNEKKCEILPHSYTPTNAWVMLADLGLYEATNEQKYLDSAKNEMSVLLDNCKDNAGCLWTLVQMARLYKNTNDSAYLENIRNFADMLLENESQEGVMMNGIEARQFAAVYSLTGEQKYLAESLNRLQKAENSMDSERLLYTVNGLEVRDFVCSAELARLELYRATKNQKYLDAVKSFFDVADISSHGKELWHQTAIEPCIENLILLYTETGDVKYWNQAYNLTQYMITYRWDSPLQQAEKYNGDGAFLFETYLYNNTKTVTDTGYAVYLLSTMKDTEFQIVDWR